LASAARAAEAQLLADRRARARECLAGLELPQFKGRPGWEFTDLSELDLGAYGPAVDGDGAGQPLFALQDAIVPNEPELPAGVIVSPLDQAALEHPGLVERYLGSLVTSEEDLFVARNEAGLHSGDFVYVPAGVVLERPILLNGIQSAPQTELHRRTLVVLEPGAQAEIWEQQLSSSPELDALFNTVVELNVGEGARLRFVCGQHLAMPSWIFGTHRAKIGRDGSHRSTCAGSMSIPAPIHSGSGRRRSGLYFLRLPARSSARLT